LADTNSISAQAPKAGGAHPKGEGCLSLMQGKPNAGTSSLTNALPEKTAAHRHRHSRTTRDTLVEANTLMEMQ